MRYHAVSQSYHRPPSARVPSTEKVRGDGGAGVRVTCSNEPGMRQQVLTTGRLDTVPPLRALGPGLDALP